MFRPLTANSYKRSLLKEMPKLLKFLGIIYMTHNIFPYKALDIEPRKKYAYKLNIILLGISKATF